MGHGFLAESTRTTGAADVVCSNQLAGVEDQHEQRAKRDSVT